MSKTVLSATAEKIGSWGTESCLELENPVQNLKVVDLNTVWTDVIGNRTGLCKRILERAKHCFWKERKFSSWATLWLGRAELCSLPGSLGSFPVFMEALLFLKAPCSLSTVYSPGHEETGYLFPNNFLVDWTRNESVLQLWLGFCRNLCFYSKLVTVVHHLKSWCLIFPCWE